MKKTQEELIAGFLDRSLSEEDLLELDNQIKANPSLRQEISELQKVEQLLKHSALPVVIPIAYVRSVEDSVAASYSSASSITTASGTAGFTGGGIITSLAIGMVAVGAVVAIWIASTSDNTMQIPVENPVGAVTSQEKVPTSPVPGMEEAAPDVPMALTSTEGISKKIVSTKSVSAQELPIVTPELAVNRQPHLGDADAVNPPSSLDKLAGDLQKCRSNGELLRCAQLGLRLASEYRKNGNLTAADATARQSLADARAVRVSNYEMDALGELALVCRDQGNMSEARRLFEQAIATGLNAGLSTLRWKNHLEVLND